jgi:hypothetical protein
MALRLGDRHRPVPRQMQDLMFKDTGVAKQPWNQDDRLVHGPQDLVDHRV